MNDQITSAAELDALPVGSILVRIHSDGSGPTVYLNDRDDGWLTATERVHKPRVDPYDLAGNYLCPLIVLYRPDQPQPDPGEVEALRAEVAALKARIADMSWGLNPDRMGQ